MSNRKIYDAWIDYKNKNVYTKKSKFCREIGCSVDLLNKSIRFFENRGSLIKEVKSARDSKGRFVSSEDSPGEVKSKVVRNLLEMKPKSSLPNIKEDKWKILEKNLGY